uniref:Uncharacterized protein n=1 Tax=Tanacetum cinerariifolium TaxID=118510 RepID=A0A6L2LUF3_TANCI|nr:hypothetical protein [Tanacetum cinerariifolium]
MGFPFVPHAEELDDQVMEPLPLTRDMFPLLSNLTTPKQKELGRDPTAAELFFRTHVKKDMKTFVDSEAKETWNHEMVQLREMLNCQKNQYDLLKAEQERMKTTQEAHTEKLDQVAKFQISLEDDLKLIQGATQKVLDLLQRRQPTV